MDKPSDAYTKVCDHDLLERRRVLFASWTAKPISQCLLVANGLPLTLPEASWSRMWFGAFHLVQPPGPKWLHMTKMASTSLPLSYGLPGRLWPFGLAPTLACLLNHWDVDRMALWLQWTAQSHLVKPPGQEWRRRPPAHDGRAVLIQPVGVAPTV